MTAPTLTERQWKILRMKCEGKKTREIAEAVYVQPQTLKNMMWHLYDRLGLARRGPYRGYQACYALGYADGRHAIRSQTSDNAHAASPAMSPITTGLRQPRMEHGSTWRESRSDSLIDDQSSP